MYVSHRSLVRADAELGLAEVCKGASFLQIFGESDQKILFRQKQDGTVPKPALSAWQLYKT